MHPNAWPSLHETQICLEMKPSGQFPASIVSNWTVSAVNKPSKPTGNKKQFQSHSESHQETETGDNVEGQKSEGSVLISDINITKKS